MDDDATGLRAGDGGDGGSAPLRLAVQEGPMEKRRAVELVVSDVLPELSVGDVVQRHMHGRGPVREGLGIGREFFVIA
jgi:hypothetical protein